MSLKYQEPKRNEFDSTMSQYNSEGKSLKSFSFSSHDIVSRRLKFNEEFSAVRRIQEEEKARREQNMLQKNK